MWKMGDARSARRGIRRACDWGCGVHGNLVPQGRSDQSQSSRGARDRRAANFRVMRPMERLGGKPQQTKATRLERDGSLFYVCLGRRGGPEALLKPSRARQEPRFSGKVFTLAVVAATDAGHCTGHCPSHCPNHCPGHCPKHARTHEQGFLRSCAGSLSNQIW